MGGEGSHGIVDTEGNDHILSADGLDQQTLGEAAHPLVALDSGLHSSSEVGSGNALSQLESAAGEGYFEDRGRTADGQTPLVYLWRHRFLRL